MNRENTGGGPFTGLKEGLAKDWEDLAWHSGSRNTVLERMLEIHSGGEAAENQVGQRAENENARWEKVGAESKPQVVIWELLAVSLWGKWAHGRVYSQIRSGASETLLIQRQWNTRLEKRSGHLLYEGPWGESMEDTTPFAVTPREGAWAPGTLSVHSKQRSLGDCEVAWCQPNCTCRGPSPNTHSQVNGHPNLTAFMTMVCRAPWARKKMVPQIWLS